MGHTTEFSSDERGVRGDGGPSVFDTQESGEWFVDFDEATSVDFNHPPPAVERQPQARPLTSPFPGRPANKSQNLWALPLESLVLDGAHDSGLALSFLNVYPTILQKFPGPPIEALGRTISYLQALFTESPAFHPFVTHLSTELPPANEAAGKRVAEDLERRLIRIVHHLFSFFYGDVNIVKQYLNECRGELVPRPLFVLSTGESLSETMINGVEDYNNGVHGGAKLWQSPILETVLMRHLGQRAMYENIRKCKATITRKASTLARIPGSSSAQQQPLPRTSSASFQPLPPPPPPTVSQQPPVVPQPCPPQPQQFSTPPGPFNQAGQITPIHPLRLPQPPQIFHVPPPPLHQMQIPAPVHGLPQPNFGTLPPPVPMSAPMSPPIQPPAPSNAPQPLNVITRSASAPGQSIKDDINRLETQLSRLLQLVESKSRH